MHSLVRFGQSRAVSAANAKVGLLGFIHAFNPGSSDMSFEAFLPRNYTVIPGLDSRGSSSISGDAARVTSSGCVSWYFGNLGVGLGLMKTKCNVAPPYSASCRNFINSATQEDEQTERKSRSMDFVRAISEENVKDIIGDSSRYGVEQNADFVHIKLIRNNTFVTVTDSKGNKKIGASSGCLPEMKGGPKLSRYSAEATAEHVGRLSRNLGLKSVVMKVNGFTYFKKKKQAILSWRDGYTYSRGDINPIVHIEDTTRRAHNGCRLPKQRRV